MIASPPLTCGKQAFFALAWFVGSASTPGKARQPVMRLKIKRSISPNGPCCVP